MAPSNVASELSLPGTVPEGIGIKEENPLGLGCERVLQPGINSESCAMKTILKGRVSLGGFLGGGWIQPLRAEYPLGRTEGSSLTITRISQVGGQAVLGRQLQTATPWLTERHGYDPSCRAQ